MARDDRPRPVVLFYHGLQTDKETHRTELESLARQGFLALGVDAVGHGQRRMSDLLPFLQRGPLRQQAAKLLRPTLEEIPLLVDFLEAEGYGPFALAGISFGGMLAFAAPQREPRLKAVLAILGDPSWCAPDDHLEAYREVALMAWNAGQDVHVPPQPAREWMQRRHQHFPESPSLYLEYPHSDHFMRAQDWADAWQQGLAWLTTHLTTDIY